MNFLQSIANVFAGALRYLANQRGEIDINNYFATDEAFTAASLTQKINHVEYVPGRLGQLGVFGEEGIRTTTVVVEEEYGTIRLIPTSPRGGTPEPVSRDRRKARSFIVPHIPVVQQVMAEEVQDLRGFGVGNNPSSGLAAIQQVVDAKLTLSASDLDATLEWHRINALKGIVLDADGSTTLFNLFTEFGVTQQTVAMALTTSTTNVIAKIREAQRLSVAKLKTATFTGWRGIAGDAFFDALVGHAKVEAFYLNSADNRLLREIDQAYGAFVFGGVIWENYRGGAVLNSGGTAQAFVSTDDAYLFPVGAPGLFMTYFAPADFMEAVNTKGLPRYSKQEPLPMGKGIKIESQTNPLCLVTKPAAIIKLTRV